MHEVRFPLSHTCWRRLHWVLVFKYFKVRMKVSGFVFTWKSVYPVVIWLYQEGNPTFAFSFVVLLFNSNIPNGVLFSIDFWMRHVKPYKACFSITDPLRRQSRTLLLEVIRSWNSKCNNMHYLIKSKMARRHSQWTSLFKLKNWSN